MTVPSKHCAALQQQQRASSSASSTPRKGLFSHEDEGIMTLKNIRNNLPNDTVAHPRVIESSAIPLCDPQILQLPGTTDSESWVVVRVLPDVFKDSGGPAVHEEMLRCSCPTTERHALLNVQRHRCENHKPCNVQVPVYFSTFAQVQFTLTAWHQTTSWNDVPRETRISSHPV